MAMSFWDLVDFAPDVIIITTVLVSAICYQIFKPSFDRFKSNVLPFLLNSGYRQKMSVGKQEVEKHRARGGSGGRRVHPALASKTTATSRSTSKASKANNAAPVAPAAATVAAAAPAAKANAAPQQAAPPPVSSIPNPLSTNMRRK